MHPEHRRLSVGLLLSLSIHALLLSLTFGGQGLGLPGFGLPWQDRRAEVPELRAVLLPAPAADAERLPGAELSQPAAAEPAMLTLVAPAPPSKSAQPANAPQAKPEPVAISKTVAAPPATPAVPPSTAKAPLPTEQPKDSVPAPTPHDDVIALAPSNKATWAVPPPQEVPEPVSVAPASTPNAEAAMPPPRDNGDTEQARALELAKLDRAKQELQRKEEQLEAARQDAARQEAARQDVAKAAAARAEAERQELAKQAAAARQDAARQDAARQDAARQEAARAEAARIEAARLAALQAEAEKREERLRAISRQLHAEADRRDAAAAAQRLSPTVSSARRGRLFGRTDPNAELIVYAEAWSRKIQLNMAFALVREAAKQPHTDPMVTVALRSDGSVESVTFVRSSGVAAIDEAIRSIVQSQANYPAFPPALTRDYDVIEIRRTWHFDMAIRLY